jgi:hypothetical protein
MIDTTRIVFFRSARGVHEVRLPAVDAVLVCHKHPVEWALTPGGHAAAPEGFVFSDSDGGGRGRIAGASVRAD